MLLRFFIFNFYHFNYNVSQCVPLWSYHIWNYLGILELKFCFLSQIREFSAIISTNNFSDSISLLLLGHLKCKCYPTGCSRGSEMASLLLILFQACAALSDCFPSPRLPAPWPVLLCHSFCDWTALGCLPVQLELLLGTFLHCLFAEVLPVSPILLRLVSTVMAIIFFTPDSHIFKDWRKKKILTLEAVFFYASPS